MACADGVDSEEGEVEWVVDFGCVDFVGDGDDVVFGGVGIWDGNFWDGDFGAVVASGVVVVEDGVGAVEKFVWLEGYVESCAVG